ncbi:MAG: hypothetical protein MUE44_30530 [Oscillatoriaceae cyanobacterium Prado104]|jgi:hypothetical protein|nr:hypothetical protein [Oscillatoriaceae cyanobacterium Prado104]
MNKHLCLGNSLLLLAAPLVASLNLSISPSNAAILAGDGMGASTQATIDRLDTLNIDAAITDQSDREILVSEDLLSILSRGSEKKTELKEDLKSFWGNFSAEINEIFASNSETEFIPIAPVNAPVNNARSQMANMQAIDLLPPVRNRDPLRVLLKSLNLTEGSDTNKQQVPTRTYTGRVKPAEINPSPVAGDSTKAPSPETKPAKEKTYTAAPSTQAVSEITKPKLAQLPSGLQGDRESFDYVKLAGGALGLGFFIWMLFQD